MREESGRIVLMDFGSGIPSVAPKYHNLAGTPAYMAPEVLGGARATPASDLYSVGVLLYYLVTGRHPVEAPDMRAFLSAHKRGEMQPLAEVSPHTPRAFVEVVDKAINRQPQLRYESAHALGADLARVAAALHAARRRRRSWRGSPAVRRRHC